MPEWLKGADCKSAGYGLRWFEPSPIHHDGHLYAHGRAGLFDSALPHDLQHFVVERALGIAGGIFGQIAAGGTAGTFHQVAEAEGSRAASRERRRRWRTANQLMAASGEDCVLPERATLICWHDWLSRSDVPALRAHSRNIESAVAATRAAMSTRDRAALSPKKVREIGATFSTLGARWQALAVGESITVEW